jgi:hypothetical protein
MCSNLHNTYKAQIPQEAPQGLEAQQAGAQGLGAQEEGQCWSEKEGLGSSEGSHNKLFTENALKINAQMQSGLRKKPPSNHVVAKNYSKL